MRFIHVVAGALGALAVLIAFSGIVAAETVVPGGVYTSSQTWTVAGSPYNLTGGVQFRNAATVTIEPGVVVQGASSSAYLQIGTANGYCCGGDSATLLALGTEADPIVFEAVNTTQGWGGIRFRGYYANTGDGTLRNVTLRDATSYAADLSNSDDVVFDNVTFDDPGIAGLYLSSSSSPTVISSSFVGGERGIYSATWDAQPTVSASDFSGQSVRYARVGLGSLMSDLTFDGTAGAVEVVAGNVTLTSSVRMTAISAPYELLDHMALRSGATLTIEPGVHMQGVLGAYFQIGTASGYCCNGDAGTLDAQGTAAEPILLEAANPASGWGGILFRAYYANTAHGVLRNVTLRDAATYAVDIYNTYDVSFDNVTFDSPGVAGLYLSSASPTVDASAFVGGQRGIYVTSYVSRPTVTDTLFVNQTVRHARVGFGAPLVDVSFEGSGSTVELVTGSTTYLSTERLRALGVPYELLEPFIIRNQATLTLDPGVHLQGTSNAYLQIGTANGYCCSGDGATLDIPGTTAEPVLLDAMNATAGWGGVRFRAYYTGTAHGVIRNTTIRDATTYAADISKSSDITFDNTTFDAPGVAGLYLASASPTVTSSSFLGGERGILAAAWDSAPTLIDTSFTDQSARHARVGLAATLENTSYSGTGTAVELLTGNQIYLTSIHLSPLSVPFDLLESIIIRNHATLTLDPGLILRVAPARYIQIGTASGYGSGGDTGHLVAEGTDAEPIRFESLTGTNETGWGGLRFRAYYFNTASGIIRNASFDDVAGSAVDVSNIAGVTLDNVSIARSTSHGVLLSGSGSTTIKGGVIDSTSGFGIFSNDASSGASVTGTTFTGPAGRPWRLRMSDVILEPVLEGHVLHEVEYYGSDITSDRTLRTYFDNATAEPYASVLLSSFTVYNTATWNILPGARVLIADAVAINIGSCCSNPGSRGNITAEGTEALPISFEARSGTNAGAWYGFYFRGDYAPGTSVFRNTTIAFSRDDGIESYAYGSLTLDNVTLNGHARYGVSLYTGGPYVFTNTRISNSGNHGIFAYSGASPTLRGGIIENSGGYGIYVNDASSGVTVLDTAIQNGTTRPLRLRIGDIHTPTLTNNAIREIEYVGTDITSDRRLAAFHDLGDGGRYASVLLNTFTVRNTATWTLEPDVRLLVENAQHINIGTCCSNPSSRGNLSIEGTTDAPVYIGSRSGATGTGWYGFYFRGDYSPGVSTLRNATIALSRDEAIDAYYYGSITLDNITLSQNARYGMQLTGTSPSITNIRITDSVTHGAHVSSSSNPTFHGGIIENNGGYGIYSSDASAGAQILDTEIRNNAQRPFRIRMTDAHAGILSNNTIRQVEYWGGDITSDRTLTSRYDTLDGLVYDSVLLTTLTVRNTATWTLDEGVRLLVENAQHINIGTCCSNPSSRGNLSIEGTTANPVYVGSRSGTTGTGWYGFYFRGDYSPGASTLRNATIALSRDEAIDAYYYGAITLDNITLSQNARYGMQLTSTSPTITNIHVLSAVNHGVLVSSSSNPDFRGGLIENNGGYGIYSSDASAGAQVLGTEFRDNAQRAFRIRITDTHSPVLDGNGIRELEYWGTSITSDLTLAPFYDEGDGARYTSVILTSPTVLSQATWTLAPDLRLLVANAQHIYIGSCCSNPSSRGNLSVEGTTAQPVFIGSVSGSATNGWYGFYLRGEYAPGNSVVRNATIAHSRDEGLMAQTYGTLVLDNVTFEDNAHWGFDLQTTHASLRNVISDGSGSQGARFYYSNPTWNGGGVTNSASHGILTSGCGVASLSDLTIQDTGGYGLYADGSCNGAHMERIHFENTAGRPFRNRLDASVVDITSTNPGIAEVELWAQTISGARTLTLEPVLDAATGTSLPTVILGTFTVNGGAVLDLAPGLDLRFRANEYVNIGSNTNSRGTVTARGTKQRPILVGGTSGAPGGWGSAVGGFDFDWATPSVFRNVTIDGAHYHAARILNGAHVTFDNATITHSTGSGIVIGSGSTALIHDSNVTNNSARGVYVDGHLDMFRSNVSENGHNGVELITASANIQGSMFFNNSFSGINVSSGNPTLLASQNYLWQNGYYGVDLQGTTGSTIIDNAFIENVQGQAHATALNVWNITPVEQRNIAFGPWSGGNSWSDYAGDDTDGDGLGDTLTPYDTGLGPGSDQHPVMGNLYADFTVSIEDILNVPRELIFRDASRGGFSPPDQWIWDLGDGTQAITENVTHTFAADGSYDVQITVANPHGQVSQYARVVHVDSIAPQTSAWVNGTLGLDGWITSSASVMLNATDDRSGVNHTIYSLDGGPALVYTTKVPVTSNGFHNLSYHSVDVNGNVEASQTVSFRLDRTPPSVANATLNGTMGNADWWTSDVTATLDASDNVSGVDRIEYGFDQTPGTTYSEQVLLATDGTTLLRYRAVDNAGLVGAEKNVTIRRDATLPEVASTLDGPLGGGGYWLGAVTANVTANDSTSGIATLAYQLDGGAVAPVNGSIAVSGHGTHVLNVTASDVAGNVNDSTSILIDIDLVAPVSEHHLQGDLGANGVYVTTVNITFTGNDSGSGIDHYVYSLNDGPNQTYAGVFALQNEGQHRLVYYAVDLAGNAETIHEIIMVLDLEAPTTNLNLAGTPGLNGWFLSNVTGTLTVDDPESLDHSVFKIGEAASQIYTGPFPISGQGIHNVSYHSVSIGGLVEANTTTQVRIDLTPPSVTAALSGTLGLAGWYVSPVDVTLLPTDNASGIATTRIGVDGAALSTYTGTVSVGTTGAHAIAAQTDDIAGRTFTMQNVSFQVDLADPITTLSVSPTTPDGAHGWYVTQPTVTLGATDAGAGVDHILLSIDGGPEEIVAGPILLAEGAHTLAYRAVDAAGRVEAMRTFDVNVDLTPPTLEHALDGTLGNAGWHVSAVDATLSPDDATSGVASIFASIDGGPEQTVTGVLSLTTTRTHVIAWRAVDAAGLVTNETLVVKVDRSPPTSTAAITPNANGFGWRNQPTTVTLSATDQPGAGSGVASIESALDGGALVTYTTPFAVGEGFHNLSFRGTDIAGLVNATATQPIKVDLTPPSLSHAMRVADRPDGWHIAALPVNLSPTDALSGPRTIEWWIDNGAHTNTTNFVVTLTAEGEHVLHVRARDFADLVSATLDIPYKLDLNPPTLSHALSGTFGGHNRSANWYRTAVELSLTALDAGSGVASTDYTLDGGAPEAYTGPLAFASEGAHTLSAVASDNVARTSATLNVPAFGVDLTAPVTTPTLDGALDPEDSVYKTPVTVTLAASDALSGIGLLRVDTGAGWVPYAGSILYDVSGDYLLRYQATDIAGNAEAITELAFSVFVDTTPPVTTLTPPPTGWFGAPVEIDLHATDVQSTVQALLYRVDGGDLVQVLGNRTGVAFATEGIHLLEYAALDVAGNLELFRNATYQVDLTPPTLTLEPTFAPGQNGWIVSPVTLTPTANDALSGVAQVVARVNGVDQVVESALTLGASGFYNVSMTAFDLAGLASDVVNWTGRIDLAPPNPNVVVVGPLGLGGWHRGNVSVLLTATDALSGVGLIEYNWDNTTWATYPGSAFQFSEEGLHWLQVRVTDLAGNVADTTGQTVGIDRTRPLIDTGFTGERGLEGWWVSPVTATTTVADLPGTPGAIPSGVHNFSRVVDSGPNVTTALPSIVDLTSSGVHNLRGYALDLALNARSSVDSVALDLDDPTLDHQLTGAQGLAGWYVGPVTLTAMSLDPTSGPAAPLLDGAPLASSTTFADDGAREITLTAVDIAGRLGEVRTLPVNIDTTPPEPISNATGDALGADGWFHGNATVTLGMLDLTSGTGPIQFRVGNGTLQTYAGPFNLSASGIHQIDWVAFDIAGNPANATLVVKLDNDLPTAVADLTGTLGNNSWFKSGVTIDLNASDPTSGIASIEYRLNGGVWLPYTEPITIASEGRHTLEYRAIDGSGLPSVTYFHEILIDVTTPLVDLHLENTLFIEFDGVLYIKGTLCIEITGLDLLSGLQDLYLQVTGVLTRLMKIELEVGLQCFDLDEAGGGGGGGGGGCGICAIATDIAGNEAEECMEAVWDPAGPSVSIIRPFQGALNLQNTSIPLFSTAFGSGVSLDDMGVGFEVETPEETLRIGGAQQVSARNATLAQTTLVAGTHVPVWVAAHDGLSPITRVELRVDDIPVGITNRTENVTYQYVVTMPRSADESPGEPTLRLPPPPVSNSTPDENEHNVRVINVTVPVYVFYIDTLQLTAGEHTFSALAYDAPGNLGKVVKLVGYISPAIGNATVNALEEASKDKGNVKGNVPNEVRDVFPRRFPSDTWEELPDQEIPPVPTEVRDRFDTFLRAARIAGQLYDFLAIDNYAFVDRTLVDELDTYETADAMLASLPAPLPPLIFSGAYTWLHPTHTDQVLDLLPLPEGGDDE